MVELQRISSHRFGWARTPSTSARCPYFFIASASAKILKILSLSPGQRMMDQLHPHLAAWPSTLPPVPASAFRKIRQDDARPLSDEYEELLTGNRIWIGRTKALAISTADDAIALSMTGADAARAAWRTTTASVPVLELRRIDFDVPTRTDSDCFARFMIRIAEMRRKPENYSPSHEENPTGRARLRSEARVSFLQSARENEDGDGSAHLPLQDFTEGFSPPPARHSPPSSRRERAGCFLWPANGSPKAAARHFRGPSFINLQALLS